MTLLSSAAILTVQAMILLLVGAINAAVGAAIIAGFFQVLLALLMFWASDRRDRDREERDEREEIDRERERDRLARLREERPGDEW
jgi:uncharacterized membrane protein